MAILQASDLKLVNNTLQMLYDARGTRSRIKSLGYKYDVPIFCINEPQQFPEKPLKEQGLNENFSHDEIQLVIRSASFTKDLELSIPNEQKIEEIKEMIKSKSEGVARIRLFYSGRELQDHHSIGQYNIKGVTISTYLYQIVQALCQKQMN